MSIGGKEEGALHAEDNLKIKTGIQSINKLIYQIPIYTRNIINNLLRQRHCLRTTRNWRYHYLMISLWIWMFDFHFTLNSIRFQSRHGSIVHSIPIFPLSVELMLLIGWLITTSLHKYLKVDNMNSSLSIKIKDI